MKHEKWSMNKKYGWLYNGCDLRRKCKNLYLATVATFWISIFHCYHIFWLMSNAACCHQVSKLVKVVVGYLPWWWWKSTELAGNTIWPGILEELDGDDRLNHAFAGDFPLKKPSSRGCWQHFQWLFSLILTGRCKKTPQLTHTWADARTVWCWGVFFWESLGQFNTMQTAIE